MKQELDDHEHKNFTQQPNTNELNRTKKYKKLFLDILDQYSQFIEYTMNESPNQGRFLLPPLHCIKHNLENKCNRKTVLELMFDRKVCSTKTTACEYAFLPIEPCNWGCPKPMVLGACVLPPEPVIPEPEPELEPTSSSLSCFDYNNDVYASIKVIKLLFLVFSQTFHIFSNLSIMMKSLIDCIQMIRFPRPYSVLTTKMRMV